MPGSCNWPTPRPRLGAEQAAFYTLASVSDDRARNAALQSTRSTRDRSRGGPRRRHGQLPAPDGPDYRNTVNGLLGRRWRAGKGKMEPFRNGVYVDAAGVLRARPANHECRANWPPPALTRSRPAITPTAPRRHAAQDLAAATGKARPAGTWPPDGPPERDMLNLAGLEKIKYVLVYPETGDLVLAGPASDWRIDDEGRHVSRTSGRPILQLDDLVVVLALPASQADGTFGCSIDPTEDGLARTKQFAEAVEQHAAQAGGSAPPGSRSCASRWAGSRSSVDGIDPRTRVAQVLVEADYRMKLVGMGLEAGHGRRAQLIWI